jgi:hypothetical protein
MKNLFGLLTLAGILISPLAAQVEVIDLAESKTNWGSAANLTTDAHEGRFAISFDVPNSKTGFLSFDHQDSGVDLTQYKRIAFWWKVEGEGLQDLKIKVRNYPLVGGMEAVYTLYDVGDAPTDWTLAVAEIAEPHFDDWGGEPDMTRRYITFRTVAAPGSNVRLFIDRMVAISETFTWTAGTPVFDALAGPDVDFDGNGSVDFADFLLFAGAFGSTSSDATYDARFDLDASGDIGFTDFVTFSQGFGASRGRWNVPLSVTNESQDSLTVTVGSQTSTVLSNRIGIGTSDVVVELPARAVTNRDTADSYPVDLWAQVTGLAETRTASTTYIPQSGPSRTWEQFRTAVEEGSEPILPRFSYAGYRQGEVPVPVTSGTIFNVADYGAVADDGQSDHSAIQAAIDAAEANGGGRVVFAAGRYLVNTNIDPREQITIESSNLVLQGAGSRAGGTIIQQINYMPPTQPENLWTSPYMFRFQPVNRSDQTLATITADSDRETFWITVNNSSNLQPGDRVKLVMTSTAAVDDFLGPYSPEPSWTTLFDTGIRVREEHTIADTDGVRVKLGEPLHTDVRSEHDWTVTDFKHISRVGIEDICFMGSWTEPFVHHQDAIHDGGWSLVSFFRVTDSWIRRCSFIDVNRAVSISNSANVSVYHTTLAGNKGHSSIAVGDSYGVWVGLSEDLAGHHHGPGSSQRTTGTVYWRYDMKRGQRIDAHGDGPYANLLDCVNGGILYGSGASIWNLPNHLKHYVLWNFNHGGSLTSYDFWRPGESSRDRFVQPIIVGFHGDPVTFNADNLEVLESQGSPVEPASLYEAQLELRLGTFPSFYQDLVEEWSALRGEALPTP